MTLEVRAASHADLDALVRLNRAVQTCHAAPDADHFKRAADPSAVKAFFAQRLDDPKSAIGIAEADRLPVGGVLVGSAAATGNAVPSAPAAYLHPSCRR